MHRIDRRVSAAVLLVLLTACGAVPTAAPQAPTATALPTAIVAPTATLQPSPAPPAPPTASAPAATATPSGPTADATNYLDIAIDHIQWFALYRDRVDWPAVRREAHQRAGNARAPADTYPAIRWVLEQLGDRHSHLLEPDVARQYQVATPPAGPGARPAGQRLDGGLGYLALPALAGTGLGVNVYAEEGVAAIRALDADALCGWVVDLRGNTGGNMWPMLAAVGPILGEGEVGAFVDAGGARQIWEHRDGQALLQGNILSRAPAYQLTRPDPPVAVLTDGRTGSSGEAVAVAFRGRPGTRSFGAPTAGVPTANTVEALRDGAWLLLTVARDADRTGQTYDAPLPPDESVAGGASGGDPADPVVRAAVAWLASQPACAGRLVITPARA